MAFVIATFYHFFHFPDPAVHKPALQARLNALELKGTLLIAPEGLNGTLAGSRDSIDNLLSELKNLAGANFPHRESLHDHLPFKRAKVRLKKEIITFGHQAAPHAAPPHLCGQPVPPAEWNHLLNDPSVLLLDARNDYEVSLGTFEGAADPNVPTFSALPEFLRHNVPKSQAIATFCTGGIRCEKLSVWLREQGWERVYQLQGGILRYLEEIPPEDSRYRGECYVFDERVAVGHGLRVSPACPACGQPGCHCPAS